MRDVCVVLTTFGDADSAAGVVRRLVDERLVACAQSDPAPIRSVYRWRGEVRDEAEVRVTLKTSAERVDALRERLEALHPYEVCEFLVLRAEASEAYGAWVVAQCGMDT